MTMLKRRRALSFEDALILIDDLRTWFILGVISYPLSRRVPANILKHKDKTFWIHEILVDIANGLEPDSRRAFDQARTLLLAKLRI